MIIIKQTIRTLTQPCNRILQIGLAQPLPNAGLCPITWVKQLPFQCIHQVSKPLLRLLSIRGNNFILWSFLGITVLLPFYLCHMHFYLLVMIFFLLSFIYVCLFSLSCFHIHWTVLKKTKQNIRKINTDRKKNDKTKRRVSNPHA